MNDVWGIFTFFTLQKTVAKDMPESPDMKFARTRFGHLLDGIRSGEIQTGIQARNRARRLKYTCVKKECSWLKFKIYCKIFDCNFSIRIDLL